MKKKRVLITGSAGMLGSAFKQCLSTKHYDVRALSHQDLDVTDSASVMLEQRSEPHWILHTAGISSPDFCENNPEECTRSHVEGTRNVVALARATGAKLFFPQTFLIFSGDTVPFSEDTTPNPLSTYGKAKWMAEQLVASALPGALIVRLGGFFGGYEKDKNFVGAFARQLRAYLDAGTSEVGVGDRIWQPSYTVELAQNVILLMDMDCSGIYNMASHGAASFFDVAVAMVNTLKISDRITIKEISAKRIQEPSTRPMNGVMASTRLAAEGLDRMSAWRTALDKYLAAPYFKELMASRSPKPLLEPFTKGGLSLRNRVVMSAMTRNRADEDHCPTNLMLEYYQRRAAENVGLILTEGTVIHPSADGYPNVPYIHTDKQIEKWRDVTRAVQEHGSRIFCQLWHCGRISHPEYLDGQMPVSSSAVQAEGLHSRLKKPYPVPRALATDEIPDVVEMFRRGARNALLAGFDGVEIHGGHGYLIDQFLDSRINQRTDSFGGSVENRCRFALEVTKAVLEVAGPEKTALRISPSRQMSGLYEWPDLEEMLGHLIPSLEGMGLRILDISCANSNYFETSGKIVRKVRPSWPHIILAGASLPPDKADEEIENGYVDLVTYGRFILANPDFVGKVESGANLVPFDPEMLQTLY